MSLSKYHQGKTQLQPTGVGGVLATGLEDAFTQYTLEYFPDAYQADTRGFIQADKLAYKNVPVRLPRQVGVGLPPHQNNNRFMQLLTGRIIVERPVLPVHYLNA